MSSDVQNNDVVIRVDHVSKCFEMYEKPRHRLQQMLFGKMLHKRWYKEFWALKDISFDIHRGEAIGLIGKNGAGKSTILQIITGTLQPTHGSVTVKDGLRVAALLELGSGFNPDFTGRENVYMNASILGLSHAETEKHFAEIEEFADIGEFIDQPVKAYSSGMMVRLAFAVQVMVKPDILIVDEALAVGDAAFQRKCYARMEQLLQGGTTLFLVTHDTETVSRICDRCIFLKKGSIFMDGPAKEVVAEYINFSFQQDMLSADKVIAETTSEPLEENGRFGLRITPNNSGTKVGVGGRKVRRLTLWGFDPKYTLMTPVTLDAEVELEWDPEKTKELCRKENLPENIALGIGLRDRRNIMIFGDNTH